MLLLEWKAEVFYLNDVGQRASSAFCSCQEKGKLPFKTIHQNYHLEYGSAALEIHLDALKRIGRCWYTMIF